MSNLTSCSPGLESGLGSLQTCVLFLLDEKEKRLKCRFLLVAYKMQEISLPSTQSMPDPDALEGPVFLKPDMDIQLHEPSCILILILTGKIIINIHYLQDFAVCSMRFTNYHICLFTQIISHAYGILHYPVLLTAGLDYYNTVVKSIHLPRLCLGFLHVILTLLLWTAALSFALYSSVPPPISGPGLSSYQCTFYVSSQTYYLSVAVLCAIVFILGICCFEVVALIKSMKLISFTNKTVLFSCGDEWPVQGTICLYTALVFSFLGTWAPFVLRKIILLILCAPIPGYMDMNVAWLYFMNSFLVGLAYVLKYPHIDPTRETFSIDPFISWKYCILPFIDIHYKAEDYLNEQLHPVMIV
ncbi:probable G-protein coupled receptor 160 isoform X1 [Xenopus laevis]|uniref:Probable G-protein coupled receptor 160 isoform X1 n=1 Tax=Xenopus laevis TaxID=8355 RepID=A0A8J1KWY5_XENLA|nr:probable G-protein coupled receptor 160 isoform X1 [Xenopus laevis]